MDIIAFFSNIDGWLYYTIVVVNTILIFAIIGYLGEKKNEEMMKYNMNTDVSASNNLQVSSHTNQTSNTQMIASIPKVAATAANGHKVISHTTQNAVSSNVMNQPVISPQLSVASNSNQQNVIVPSINGSVSLQNANQVPSNNTSQNVKTTNESVPAVLIINTNSTNKDAK